MAPHVEIKPSSNVASSGTPSLAVPTAESLLLPGARDHCKGFTHLTGGGADLLCISDSGGSGELFPQDSKLTDSREGVLFWLCNAGRPGTEKVLIHSFDKRALSTYKVAGTVLPPGLQRRTKQAKSPVLFDILVGTPRWAN